MSRATVTGSVGRRRPPWRARRAPRRRCAAATTRAARNAPTPLRAHPPACPRRTAWPTHKPVQRELRGRARVVTGPARGHADVLLVHPRVHDPDVHELPVRDFADRARADLVEAGLGPRPQLAPGGAPSPLGIRRGRRARAEHVGAPPTPRCGRRPRSRRGGGNSVSGGGSGSPSSTRSIADQVRQHVTHRPPRALRGKLPLPVAEVPARASMASHSSARIEMTGSWCSRHRDDPLLGCGCDRCPCSGPTTSVTTRRHPGQRHPPPSPVRAGPACLPSACAGRAGDSFEPTSGGAHSEEDERGFVRGLLCEMP